MQPDESRRRFLLRTSIIAGGFAIGWAQAATPRTPHAMSGDGAALQDGALPLTDWIRITRDDVVTLVVSQAEMGQGISTTLPAILCGELGADWARVRFELAPTAPPYRNPDLQWQFTGNSQSMQSFAKHMREVGATARTMLVAAAAKRWNVAPEECTTADGKVLHRPSGKAFNFGEVVEGALPLAAGHAVQLRPDAEVKALNASLPRVDIPAKVDGSAQFGIDYIPDGLTGVLFAAVRSGPAYGAKLVKLDRAAIKACPGVIAVVELPGAVAVVAAKYWQARAALNAAEIEFDHGSHPKLSSASLRATYLDKIEHGPFVTVKDDKPAPMRAAFTATYELPFQAHATMEPMNALALVRADGVDVWAPTQGQELAKYAVAGALQVAPDTVRIHRSPYLGGGFGRRLLPDFIIDAVLIAKAVGKPVKTIWSREEDMRRDHYRPATMHRISAVLDRAGYPAALSQRLVCPTILKPVFPTLDLSKGVDPSSLEGTLSTPYAIGSWRTDFHLLDIPVPTSVYRTTGYGPNLFGLESFIDELAHRARKDPLRYRRELLKNNPRALRVLNEAAERAGWNRTLPRGHGRGVALVFAFESLVAQVVEVSVKGKTVHVERVVSVVDPGSVFDEKIAEAGIEGGIVFGLSTVARHEITFADGGPVQKNFNEYDFVRMQGTPRIDTHFLRSPGVPLGAIGEVGPVAVVPALANAIFAACGRRLRTMPLARSGMELV